MLWHCMFAVLWNCAVFLVGVLLLLFLLSAECTPWETCPCNAYVYGMYVRFSGNCFVNVCVKCACVNVSMGCIHMYVF